MASHIKTGFIPVIPGLPTGVPHPTSISIFTLYKENKTRTNRQIKTFKQRIYELIHRMDEASSQGEKEAIAREMLGEVDGFMPIPLCDMNYDHPSYSRALINILKDGYGVPEDIRSQIVADYHRTTRILSPFWWQEVGGTCWASWLLHELGKE